MRIKNLTVPTESELVCQYLTSLKMNTIFSDTLRKFDDQTWYYNKSWIQIMIWCKNEIGVFHTINGTAIDTPPPTRDRNTPDHRRSNNDHNNDRTPSIPQRPPGRY